MITLDNKHTKFLIDRILTYFPIETVLYFLDVYFKEGLDKALESVSEKYKEMLISELAEGDGNPVLIDYFLSSKKDTSNLLHFVLYNNKNIVYLNSNSEEFMFETVNNLFKSGHILIRRNEKKNKKIFNFKHFCSYEKTYFCPIVYN